MRKDQSVLQERVAARLAELRRSPRDVSLKAGLGPDAIRTILSGRSRSPRGDTLTALADELQCDVAYLLGTIDTPHVSEVLRTNELGTVRGIDKMRVAGVIQHAWRPLDDPDQNAEWPSSDVYSLPEFLPGYQTLERVLDDSADALAPLGSYLHVLSFAGTFDIVLRDKDVVVVQQQRITDTGAGEIRRTCWEVRRYRDDLIALRSATTVRPYQDEIVLEGRLLKVLKGEAVIQDNQAISLEGLVLRVVAQYAGPPIERPHA